MAVKLNRNLKILFHYLIYNWIFAAVGAYFILSLIIFSYFDINVAIPCLIKLITGFKCPGCGLSHAFAHLIKLEFTEMWEANKFSFIVFPAGVYYIVKDFIAFRKKAI